jgi:hypothetical protein
VSAQEPEAQAAADDAGVIETTTGTVVLVADEDGRDGYYLQMEDGSRIELDFGPPWFWGDESPLAAFLDQTVAVGGSMRDGVSEQAADVAPERATAGPSIDVETIDGERLREPGKPPWAGGPKLVGKTRPGFAGWSRGQSDRVETAPSDSGEG